MFDVFQVGNPYVLGMAEEEFENEVDALVRQSRITPVSRATVYALLDSYHVTFGDLSSWLRGKVGDIEVCD